jgi:hypothetical protein
VFTVLYSELTHHSEQNEQWMLTGFIQDIQQSDIQLLLTTRLTFAIAANGDVTLVRLLKNLNILNKKYPIFDFDFDGFDSRVPAYRSPYSS